MLKKCPNCQFQWENAYDLVEDLHIILQGYQSNFTKIEEGYYIFLHDLPQCQTSFSIPVKEFSFLYKGPPHSDVVHGTPRCEGHCLHESDLGPCQQACHFAQYREVMKLFKRAK